MISGQNIWNHAVVICFNTTVRNWLAIQSKTTKKSQLRLRTVE